MKKPFLLFAVKCTVILYFAACTNIEDYTLAKSATPVVTCGSWKVNLFLGSTTDDTHDYTGYTFTFNTSGALKVSKNGNEVNGNWTEDNISKQIVIDLGTTDPNLLKLNKTWLIRNIKNTELELENTGLAADTKLNFDPIFQGS